MLTYNGEEGTPYSFCPHKCGQCSSQETGSNTGSNGNVETGTGSNTGSNENNESTNGNGGTSKNKCRIVSQFFFSGVTLSRLNNFNLKPFVDKWGLNTEQKINGRSNIIVKNLRWCKT